MTEDGADCPRCRSRRVVEGRMVGPNDVALAPTWFRFGIPANPFLRLVWGIKRKMVVHEVSQLCVDCGMIWTSVDPEFARKIIRDRGNEDLKNRLNLVEKPAAAEDDFA